jgi:hypothetical protein
MMKFKLGLMIGGAVGYLIGSGKGAQMWSDYRARSRAENELLDFTDLAAGDNVGIVVEETFVATSDLG